MAEYVTREEVRAALYVLARPLGGRVSYPLLIDYLQEKGLMVRGIASILGELERETLDIRQETASGERWPPFTDTDFDDGPLFIRPTSARAGARV